MFSFSGESRRTIERSEVPGNLKNIGANTGLDFPGPPLPFQIRRFARQMKAGSRRSIRTQHLEPLIPDEEYCGVSFSMPPRDRDEQGRQRTKKMSTCYRTREAPDFYSPICSQFGGCQGRRFPLLDLVSRAGRANLPRRESRGLCTNRRRCDIGAIEGIS